MIEVIRFTHTDTETIGAMLIDKEPICWTLEDAWKNNDVGVSCIPEGLYRAERKDGTIYRDAFFIYDLEGREVAERKGILIHSGNTHADTRGCILLGSEVGKINGELAILESKKAYAKFKSKMERIDECNLLVRSV